MMPAASCSTSASAPSATTPGAATQSSPPLNPHRVLLLLDVQTFILSPPPIGVPSARDTHSNISQILSAARAAHPPPLIIHVRNTGDPGDPDAPHTPGWNLMFPPLLHEVILDKRKNNAFAGTHLSDIIPPDAELVVAGFQTDYSVRATCSAALGRGNEVLLIRGAHATFDRIEVLHGGGVTPAERIEDEIEAELEEAGVHLLDMKDLPGIFVDR
ncbi:Isochorismatase-like protein, partial [Infundibulicybe gibba]